MSWTVYSSDGFQKLGEFSSEMKAHAAIAEQRYGSYSLESPGGEVRSLTIADARRYFFSKTSTARLDADRTARPMTAIRQYRNVSPSGRVSSPSPYYDPTGNYTPGYSKRAASKASGGRNGTGHTHPPGRTRCPKCGV